MTMDGCASKLKKFMTSGAPDSSRLNERTTTREEIREQEIQSLKDLNAKLTEHAEWLASQLQQIRDSRNKEHVTVEEKIGELEQTVADLTSQYQALQDDMQKTKRENKTLKTSVARYRKDQRERRQLLAQNTVSAHTTEAKSTRSSNKATPKPKRSKALVVTSSAATPARSSSDSSLVNINMASPNDLTQTLGLPQEAVNRLVNNRPYRIKGELVAKQVLPKETFYLIKDRLTAVQ
jgi:DNA uptake protein ComE-like DNA-binding protein